MVTVVLFIGGIVLHSQLSKVEVNKKKLLQWIGQLMITMGFIGGILIFFSYENVRFLGSKFWYLLWVLSFIGWTIGIEIVRRKMKKAESLITRKDDSFLKYLPKKKNKKNK